LARQFPRGRVRRLPRDAREINWDAAQRQVPGVPAADEIIHGTYRAGWEVT
jgi:hypothetical protein